MSSEPFPVSQLEEFLNLLLYKSIFTTNTNWFQADNEKFTSSDFNRFLAKCKQQKFLNEISRIMKLDDLSKHATHSIMAMSLSTANLQSKYFCYSLPCGDSLRKQCFQKLKWCFRKYSIPPVPRRIIHPEMFTISRSTILGKI